VVEAVSSRLLKHYKKTRCRATIEAPENCIFLCVFGGGTMSGKHDPWTFAAGNGRGTPELVLVFVYLCKKFLSVYGF